MDSRNTKVLEALQMQPLSEEEKARRHILGRLWGPIATSKEKTRNGRGYNAELWERALADEIFKEKVANKSLFLELGHPVDREETDMRMVCACIPELPKVIDGDLYAYVDILDTKDGQLLKMLCDYGFVPGISSRGSGDIMANDEVDPETFFLETWDIVQLPAVKKARLAVCESLNNKKSLSTALRESFDKMNEQDRADAQAALERLGVDYKEEPITEEAYPDIPWGEGEEPLMEKTENIETVLEPVDAEPTEVESSEEDTTVAKPEDETTLTEADDEEAEVEEASEEAAEDAVDALTDESTEDDAEKSEEETDYVAIGDLINNLQDFDPEAEVEFTPIEIDGNTITITELVLDDEEEGKVNISFSYDLETSDNIEDEESEVEVDKEDEDVSKDEPTEDKESEEEAIDDGDDEVIESLMEMVRQKDELEETVQGLKNQQAVSDAEVSRLKEELEKYKTGFMRVSELASKANKLQKEVKSLNEQLSTKDATIQTLQTKISTHTKLTESADASKRTITDLREKLSAVQSEAETTEQGLREQLETSRAAAQKNAKAANAYKQKYNTVIEHYIASKATMLGVNARDITNKLQEGFTLADIDRVCESLLDAGRPAFGLGMRPQTKTKVKINESVKHDDDDGFDDLLILAGLK